MVLTDHEISLVQTSFRKVAPGALEAAALFYARLFELDPALRGLFHGEMRDQEQKLMTALALAVSSLKHPDVLRNTVRALGERHASYGVRNEHYDTVGRALLWTLEKRLSDDFTPEVRAAWANLYALLATEMREGMRRVSTPRDAAVA
ncbi:MAG TPA: globin family protein [Opitutaceae bacterium]